MWTCDGGTRDERVVEQVGRTKKLTILVWVVEEAQDGGGASGDGREPDVEK